MTIGVGAGITGIYAGTIKTRSDGTREFTGIKTNVTTDVLCAAATWIKSHGPQELYFQGKKHVLKFEEVKE